MNEYRCTRNSIYGNVNPTLEERQSRQGHYIRCETPEQAVAEMCRRYPQDSLGFTVDLFKVNGEMVGV